LSAFLLHVVRCTIEGRTDELTEQQIGVQVFSRALGYNPGEDNIVRTTVRQLRRQLALYYQEEGFTESLRIQVPRGGYIPVFVAPEVPVQSLPVEPQTAVPATQVPAQNEPLSSQVKTYSQAHSRFHVSWKNAAKYAAVLLLGAALALFVDCGVLRTRHSASAADPLWNEIFRPG
jgi:hypothetical protein